MDISIDFLDKILSLKFAVGILALVLWIGYLIYSLTMIGRIRVLSRVLKTGLSSINVLVTWVHFGVVLFVGLIALILVIF